MFEGKLSKGFKIFIREIRIVSPQTWETIQGRKQINENLKAFE